MPEYVDYIASFKWIYLCGIGLGLVSIPYFYISKGKYSAIFILFLSVLLTNTFFILADPYLYLWDEQFHALVAKNLLENPFYPFLLDSKNIAETSPSWVENHIWLHKQPAFLWLITLSFKIFGVSYWSLRLPSALLSALQIFAIYGIGKRVLNKETGFWASVFFSAAAVFVPIITGRIPTDHNDAVFAAFVLFSIFYYFKYLESPKIKYIIFIGLFAGLAILTKWLVGLLVFSAWGIIILTNRDLRKSIISYFHIGLSLFITLVIAVPWQIYAFIKFPEVYRFENKAMGSHFTNVVEGHSGPWNYYLNILNDFVAPNFQYISILAIIVFALPIIKVTRKYKFSILFYILFVYLFFSISATKMVMFTNPVLPLIMIVMAAIIIGLTNKIFQNTYLQTKSKLLKPFIIILISLISTFWIYDNYEYKLEPGWRRMFWKHYASEASIFEKVASQIEEPENTMVFNFPEIGNIRFTFITGINSRSYIPDSVKTSELIQKGLKLYIFDNNELPNYITNNQNIKIIESNIWKPDNMSNDFFIK